MQSGRSQSAAKKVPSSPYSPESNHQTFLPQKCVSPCHYASKEPRGRLKKIINKCNQLLFRRHPKKSYFCPINVPTKLAFQSSLCDNSPIVAVPAEENCYCPNSPFVALIHESVSGSNQLFPAISEFATPPAVHFFSFFPAAKIVFVANIVRRRPLVASLREIWLWQLC